MKINPAAAYGIYKSNVKKPVESDNTVFALGEVRNNKHTDQISISSEGARQSEVEKVSRSIVADLEKPTPPEKLDAIRSAVKDKTYHVPTADLVDAVMGRWFGL